MLKRTIVWNDFVDAVEDCHIEDEVDYLWDMLINEYDCIEVSQEIVLLGLRAKIKNFEHKDLYEFYIEWTDPKTGLQMQEQFDRNARLNQFWGSGLACLTEKFLCQLL